MRSKGELTMNPQATYSQHKPVKEILARHKIYNSTGLALYDINQMTRRQVYSFLKARGFTYNRERQQWIALASATE
jgi:hypothetical protein